MQTDDLPKEAGVRIPTWYWYALVACVVGVICVIAFVAPDPAKSEAPRQVTAATSKESPAGEKDACRDERCMAYRLYFALITAREAEKKVQLQMWSLQSHAQDLRTWADENLYKLEVRDPERAVRNSVNAMIIEEYAGLLEAQALLAKERGELLARARQEQERTLYLIFRTHPDLEQKLEAKPEEARFEAPTPQGRRFSLSE